MTSVKIDGGSVFIMESCDILQPHLVLWAARRGAGRLRYLHPEEGDAGQEINGRLQVLETLGVSCWEIILRRERGKRTEG